MFINDLSRHTFNRTVAPTVLTSKQPVNFTAPTDGYLIIYVKGVASADDSQMVEAGYMIDNQFATFIQAKSNDPTWRFDSIFLRKDTVVTIKASIANVGGYGFESLV